MLSRKKLCSHKQTIKLIFPAADHYVAFSWWVTDCLSVTWVCLPAERDSPKVAAAARSDDEAGGGSGTGEQAKPSTVTASPSTPPERTEAQKHHDALVSSNFLVHVCTFTRKRHHVLYFSSPPAAASLTWAERRPWRCWRTTQRTGASSSARLPCPRTTPWPSGKTPLGLILYRKPLANTNRKRLAERKIY